ncbi:unnamed protein product, partial [Adineta steineri]
MYKKPSSCRQIERYIEEPIRIKCCRRRRRHHHHHHRRHCRSHSSSSAPLPPIIIPFAVPAPAAAPQQQPQLQITEYVQDIYPPAQVFTEQVPIGYVAGNSGIQQSNLIQSQPKSLNCQSGIMSPSIQYVSSSSQIPNQLIQRLSSG